MIPSSESGPYKLHAAWRVPQCLESVGYGVWEAGPEVPYYVQNIQL